jgi:hypothetical protein
MNNCMSLAEKYIAEMREKYCSVKIDYISQGGNTVFNGISATLGRTLFKSNNDYGVDIISHGRDFIIKANAISTTPSLGDIILCNGKRYEVLAPNDEPVWRYSGSSNESLRIHTKEVTEVDNE